MKTGILLMLLTSLSAPKPDPKHFGYELATTAPPEAIWQIWTDVDGWHRWDTGLRAAQLTGPFLLGAEGVLVPDKGPKSKFEVVAFEAGKSYTISTPFPGGSLEVKRTLRTEAGTTIFRHEVTFKGITGGLFARILGKRYQPMLPDVLAKIKSMAER